MEKKYYRTNMSGVTVREYWRMCKFNPIIFPIAIILFKIFRMRGEITMAQCYIENIIRLAPDEVPRDAELGVQAMVEECQREGIHLEYFYKLEMFTPDLGVGVVLSSPDPRFSCQILFSKSKEPSVPTICFFTCYSVRADGTYVITSGNRKQVDEPPGFDVEYKAGSSVRQILERHRARIGGHADLATWTPEMVIEEIVRLNNETLEDSIAKGKAVELSIFELTELKRKLGYYR